MNSAVPHLAGLAARPTTTDAEDAPGRARFARSIADILSAPLNETLRIGIHSGRRDGKTSVLRLIETRLRAEGHSAVWITPGSRASREALCA